MLKISQAFRYAKKKIGADDIIFTPTLSALKATTAEFNRGGSISGADLQKVSEIWISKAPLIDEDGNAFVLYIPDWQYNFSRGRHAPRDLHKYHVSWCDVLEYMQDAGRLKKYIKKTDVESNIFKGKDANDSTVQSELYACKMCRENMSKKFNNLYFDVENMDLLKFFALHGKQKMSDPKTNRPYSVVYPKHWNKISRIHREKANWTCDECRNSFINTPALLDVHHIDGVRSNVKSTNLRVLCKGCHSKQPLHGHYKPFANTRSPRYSHVS